MSETRAAVSLDDSWLNDRTEFQRNFVHGLRNPHGLHIQYRLERLEGEPDPGSGLPPHRVVGEWVPDPLLHVGFPGVTHGGLVSAVLDDVMGRSTTLLRLWTVTGRLEVRYRGPAPAGTPLRVEGWMTGLRRRMVTARGRLLLPGGGTVAEAWATYLPLTPELERRMVERWPGFAAYLGDGAV
ncbi:MAG: thioesterase superfamily protein [Chloroflexi bacterium]|jgi:acyl-coenzyme A thioesterase PaaI-like protein|nr:thioesterase superfamily protein [Chloroflexota bacterium]